MPETQSKTQNQSQNPPKTRGKPFSSKNQPGVKIPENDSPFELLEAQDSRRIFGNMDTEKDPDYKIEISGLASYWVKQWKIETNPGRWHGKQLPDTEKLMAYSQMFWESAVTIPENSNDTRTVNRLKAQGWQYTILHDPTKVVVSTEEGDYKLIALRGEFVIASGSLGKVKIPREQVDFK